MGLTAAGVRAVAASNREREALGSRLGMQQMVGGSEKLSEVLAAWREAERELDRLVPGSREWVQMQAEIEELREKYASISEDRAS